MEIVIRLRDTGDGNTVEMDMDLTESDQKELTPAVVHAIGMRVLFNSLSSFVKGMLVCKMIEDGDDVEAMVEAQYRLNSQTLETIAGGQT